MDQEAYEALRNIQLMDHEGLDEATKSTKTAVDSEDKDFLEEALAGGSKTIDYDHQGSNISINRHGKMYLPLEPTNKKHSKLIDILG